VGEWRVIRGCTRAAMLTNRNGIHKIFCRVRVLIKLQIAVNCSKNRIRQSFYYSPDVDPSTDYRYLKIRYNEISSVILCA